MSGWIPGSNQTGTGLWTEDHYEADGEGQGCHRRDFHSKLEDHYCWSSSRRILPPFELPGCGNVAKTPLKKRKGVPKERKNP